MPTPRQYATAAQRQAAYRLRCQARVQAAAPGPVVPNAPGRRRWKALCAQAEGRLEQVCEEMQACYEQRPEAWQDSERGEAFRELLEAVAEIVSLLTEVQSL